jgi:hypothetical protein
MKRVSTKKKSGLNHSRGFLVKISKKVNTPIAKVRMYVPWAMLHEE